MTTDIIAQAEAALDGVTLGRAVQFHPSYCKEAEDTPFTEWDTSHDLSVIRPDGTRYRIGTFRHANDAAFDQWCRAGVPALIARVRELERERERLALAICGGEDAPGYANAQTVETLEKLARDSAKDMTQEIDRTLAAEATVATLTAQVEAMRGAAGEVLRISDRDHEAWHRLRAEIKKSEAGE